MIAALAMTVALVAEPDATLRAAPRESAAAQARLVRGEWLEVRGEEAGWLKVYDHRRERPGYVRPAAVHVHDVDPASAPALRAVVAFLRETRGSESLGIAYAALALRADPRASATPLQAAIGEMADRFARGLSPKNAAERDVLEDYGVKLIDLDRGDRVQVCYDGAAFHRVLSAPDAPGDERLRAALALTDRSCALSPAAAPALLKRWNEWRADVLAQVDPDSSRLGQLVRLRRAEISAARAFELAREGRGDAEARLALDALAGVDRARLADDDRIAYADAALRVSTVRWAVEKASRSPLELRAGKPGETCLRVEGLERCTSGVVWPGSVRATRSAITVVVQPTESWTELYVFHRAGKSWRLDVVPPALDGTLGYIESAGVSPDGSRLLVAREALIRNRLERRFEVRRLRDLRTLSSASEPDVSPAFARWSSPVWRGTTVAVR